MLMAMVQSGSRNVLFAAVCLCLVALRLIDWTDRKEQLLDAPLQPKTWLALAEKRASQGRLAEAKAIVGKCLGEAGPVSPIRLQAATLAIELGDYPSAFRQLRFVFRYDPALRRQAVYSAKGIWGEQGGLRLVPPGNAKLLAAYFALALDESWFGEASQIWERSKREKGPLDRSLARRYVETLWEADRLEEAREVWNTLFGDQGIVWNGGFEEDLLGWGFGWKTKPQIGVVARRDEKNAAAGKAALRIRVAGLPSESDRVLAEQTVLLSPSKRYELHAKGRADGLSSSSGMVVEVADRETGTVWGTTAVLNGTTDWTKLSASVEVPEDGGTAVLQIKWKGTSEWEIPVYGTGWFDELEIVESRAGVEFKGGSALPGIRTP